VRLCTLDFAVVQIFKLGMSVFYVLILPHPIGSWQLE